MMRHSPHHRPVCQTADYKQACIVCFPSRPWCFSLLTHKKPPNLTEYIIDCSCNQFTQVKARRLSITNIVFSSIRLAVARRKKGAVIVSVLPCFEKRRVCSAWLSTLSLVNPRNQQVTTHFFYFVLIGYYIIIFSLIFPIFFIRCFYYLTTSQFCPRLFQPIT